MAPFSDSTVCYGGVFSTIDLIHSNSPVPLSLEGTFVLWEKWPSPQCLEGNLVNGILRINLSLPTRNLFFPHHTTLFIYLFCSKIDGMVVSWAMKKAEWWRIDAFELWCWRRLLRVTWTARKLNQSILKEISPEYSLEGLMLKLKFQYFGHLMRRQLTHWKRPWCWERLKPGEEGDNRGRDGWMASPTQWTWVWASSGRWWRTGKPDVLQFIGSQRVEHNSVTEQESESVTAW